MTRLTKIITSEDVERRNQSLDSVCCQSDLFQLLRDADELDRFWRQSENLYHRVRAMFFLSEIHRYYVPKRLGLNENPGLIPHRSYCHYLERRFTEAIDGLLSEQQRSGPSAGLSSALAQAYRDLGFQTLADQVRHSVRSVRGNQWMFRIGHPLDHPLRFREVLKRRIDGSPLFPVLAENTAVRMDFSHSGWSDIFFLGMDYPEGARVINASIDLGVRSRDPTTKPPIETYLRVIDEPVLRLVSLDLDAQTDIHTIAEVFDFAKDYLGLLKAGVIASGVVPPGMEGSGEPISDLLNRLVGPGLGLELVSRVNGIPKGSRLAVSTNLLGSLIALCMRATGQVASLVGPLAEQDRRLIAARAILGEWIGGSGGGWQDSGGVWPGIKLISGAVAQETDPEFGISRGRLLPNHTVFGEDAISAETLQRLQESLVLVHGGMAQNVGPILEMVTEKYLLRSPAEWEARQTAIRYLDEIHQALKQGNIRAIGDITDRNFHGPLQTIIPWCTNLYTSSLVAQSRQEFAEDFWGFWMLGGMAGGGMGFIFSPDRKSAAQDWLQDAMANTKRELQHALPFAMEPVVYNFAINEQGSVSKLLDGNHPCMPDSYYTMMLPAWLRSDLNKLPPQTRWELETVGQKLRNSDWSGDMRPLFNRIFPGAAKEASDEGLLDEQLIRFGFDRQLHEQIRSDLHSRRLGLFQNRLAPDTIIDDARPEDIVDLRDSLAADLVKLGRESIQNGEVGIITLAAGVGSRWTEGAGVVKGLHPFCRLSGEHRSFLEVHLAKTRRVSEELGCDLPHVVTTGYLTHQPISEFLCRSNNYGYPGQVVLSEGRYVGLRTIPMVGDLQFAWEELPQQVLGEQQQKVRSSLRAALINWARQMGEGSDYRDNVPLQCLHPVGHWYEFPNLLRNGVLRQLLEQRPQLKYLMLHNVDTLGASLDPGVLGQHIQSENCMSFEVIHRHLEDRGGGLANVNGKLRLLEGMALPNEEDEFRLTYYNSATNWIHLQRLLNVFGLTASDLADDEKVDEAIRQTSRRIPTYVTIKDVKKRWGQGQEDVFPVTQFEKLWGDMTALPDVDCGFFLVPRPRGQQLKEQAQLDGWVRDGSADYVDSICEWSR